MLAEGKLTLELFLHDEAGNESGAVTKALWQKRLQGESGWNLLAFPGVPVAADGTDLAAAPAPYAALFPGMHGQVWRWNADAGTYTPTTELPANEGWWIFLTAPVVTGVVFGDYAGPLVDSQLTPGAWNLVGVGFEQAGGTPPGPGSWGWRWRPDTRVYESLGWNGDYHPFTGYWLWVD